MAIAGLSAWLGSGCAVPAAPGFEDLQTEQTATPPQAPAELETARGPVSADGFCAQLAATICESREDCCEVPTADNAGTTNCITSQMTECSETLSPLLDDPRLAYSDVRGGEFLANLEASAKDCWTTAVTMDDFMNVFDGSGAEGSDCTPAKMDEQQLRLSQFSCAGDLSCHIYLRADGKPMGMCEAPDDNNMCSHALDCGPSERCNLPNGWVPGRWGVCQPLRATGWDCAADTECESHYCNAQGKCEEPSAQQYCPTSYSDVVAAEEPVGYWRLHDAAQGNAVAAGSAGSPDALYVGNPSSSDPSGDATHGGLSTPVNLDGQDDRVRVSMPAPMQVSGSLTMEAWFRPSATSEIQPIVELVRADGKLGPHIWNYHTGDRVFVNFVDDKEGGHTILTDAGVVKAGKWHHVVATYDGSVGRLYVDGKQVGTTAGNFKLPNASTIDIAFAKRSHGNYYFRGNIDEVAIYEKALSKAAVERHHSQGGKPVSSTPFALFEWMR